MRLGERLRQNNPLPSHLIFFRQFCKTDGKSLYGIFDIVYVKIDLVFSEVQYQSIR